MLLEIENLTKCDGTPDGGDAVDALHGWRAASRMLAAVNASVWRWRALIHQPKA